MVGTVRPSADGVGGRHTSQVLDMAAAEGFDSCTLHIPVDVHQPVPSERSEGQVYPYGARGGGMRSFLCGSKRVDYVKSVRE